jgi:hypothetical protein
VPAALDELNTRIAEIRADLAFVALATKLRPRIHDVIRWDAAGEAIELVRQFMNAKASRPEGLYGPLLVRLLAAFERYVRLLVVQSVEHVASLAAIYDDVPETMTRRNVKLTGRILAAVDSPRDHLKLDVESLVSNLATCKRGNGSFRLNAAAFAATVSGAAPSVVEQALDDINLPKCWDGVGGSVLLAKLLQTKGTRATGDRAYDRLKELSRWRNNLAHGGDEEIALTEAQLIEAIDFIHAFGAALNSVVEKRLKKP